MVRLISPYFAVRDLNRYLKRQRCSPQPGMRRAVRTSDGYQCWVYEQYEWTVRSLTMDRGEAVSWWLGDPWLPDQEFEYGILADGHAPEADELVVAFDPATWSPARWEAAAAAIVTQVTIRTGVRPVGVGPESTGAPGGAYQRMLRDDVAAEISWTHGRLRGSQPRGHCYVRMDLPDPLRCVVLAEAIVLLSRRPHAAAQIAITEPPAGIAADAAALLVEYSLPRQALHMLLR
jgi:hypothetical protein